MLPTDGSNWYVRELPRRMLVQEERHSDDGQHRYSDAGEERVHQLTGIADSNCVWAAGGLNHSAEGTKLAVLQAYISALNACVHLPRDVVAEVVLPDLHISVEWATIGVEDDLHLLHVGVIEPSLAGTSSRNEDGRVGVAIAELHRRRRQPQSRQRQPQSWRGRYVQLYCWHEQKQEHRRGRALIDERSRAKGHQAKMRRAKHANENSRMNTRKSRVRVSGKPSKAGAPKNGARGEW